MLRLTSSLFRNRKKMVVHRSSQKNAKRGHLQTMPWISMGSHPEVSESYGHELEAFENFGVYADTYESSPHLRYTDDFEKLTIHEQMDQLVHKMEAVWRGKDDAALIQKLQLCVRFAKSFADLCAKDKAALEDYTQDYQRFFYQVVEAGCRIAPRVMHAYPDAPAALLHIAQTCVTVGEDDLEQKCLSQSAFLIGKMGEDIPEIPDAALADEAAPAGPLLHAEPVKALEAAKAPQRDNKLWYERKWVRDYTKQNRHKAAKS